jgi:hypothetical protein
MSEDRSVLYKIRWEILVMAASLILSAVVVLAIPNDFSDKMLKQQKAEREAAQKALEDKLAGSNQGESIRAGSPP